MMSRLALLLLATLLVISVIASTIVSAQEDAADNNEEAAVEDSTAEEAEEGQQQQQELPYLYLHKDVSEVDTTPGQTVTVTVTAKNIGAASAYDVVLTDKAPFSEEQTKKVEELAPGDNITIEYTVTPQSIGHTDLPMAEASFSNTQGNTDAATRVKVISNEVREEVRDEKQTQVEVTERGFINVITPEELAKLTATKWKEYVLYAILAAIAVLMPYYQSRTTGRQVAMLIRDAKRSK